jgi:hypothetical protein
LSTFEFMSSMPLSMRKSSSSAAEKLRATVLQDDGARSVSGSLVGEPAVGEGKLLRLRTVVRPPLLVCGVGHDERGQSDRMLKAELKRKKSESDGRNLKIGREGERRRFYFGAGQLKRGSRTRGEGGGGQ